ncbi:MAG: OmpA family protein [Gammaproteobacteria bacterium]|nr:OmpA family protein [Gammaproteobacteria bacterium]
MKHLSRAILLSGVLLGGCVSTKTFDEKQTELTGVQKQLAACETRAKSELETCASTRQELDAKLSAANQELGVFRQAAEAKQHKLDELQKQEEQLRQQLQQELTDKSVEIEQLKGQLSVRMLDKIVFASGSAELLPQGTAVLDKLAEALKGNEQVIRIEGHTDDTPISGKLKNKYPSNWELSAARAAAVARYFENKHQIDPKRLESLGFSMYRPVVPNDSPENKLRNRRVEIVLKPMAETESTATTPEPAVAPAAPEPTMPATP